MIKAQHHPLFVFFFKHFSRFMLKKYFHEIILEHTIQLKPTSILIIANHFSWWDGFIIDFLNHKLFKKKLHILMLEDQLQNRSFLNKAGAYSIQKNSKTIIDSINYTASVLDQPSNLVALFPQGKITSLYEYPLEFEKGIVKIIEKTNTNFQFIFLSVLVNYFSNKKPTLYLSLKEFKYDKKINHDQLTKEFNDFHISEIKKQSLKSI